MIKCIITAYFLRNRLLCLIFLAVIFFPTLSLSYAFLFLLLSSFNTENCTFRSLSGWKGGGVGKKITQTTIYIANSVCYRKLFIYRKLNGEIFSYVFFFALSNSALWKCVYWARVRLPFCMTIETWAGVLLPKLLPFTFRPNRLLSIYHTFLWLLLLLFIPNSTLNPNRFLQFKENEWKKYRERTHE